ncbi:BppU family phage baseplate upper protein [Romboutsia sp.]|uniref:BppU family phage baseplate upper protein n=1 Tax=Romboutsia sp. TaxID=1965302 RepID=UPI003F2FD46E
MKYTNLDKVVKVKLDISKNDWDNEENIQDIEFNQGDVDTSYLEIEVVNNDLTVDLANKKIICDIISPKMCKISQTEFNYRLVIYGNVIKHKLNSDMISERGTYKIQYSILDLETNERKYLTRFKYKSTECLFNTTESKHRQEVFIEIFKELSTKLNEEQVRSLIEVAVEGGIDLSGYAKVDHSHNYMTFYQNSVLATTFNNGDIICREVGGTI